jgi:hypothetical protein
LNRGHVEINPIAVHVLVAFGVPGLVAFKALTTSIVVALVVAFYGLRFVRLLAIAILVLQGLVVLNNLTVVWEYL